MCGSRTFEHNGLQKQERVVVFFRDWHTNAQIANLAHDAGFYWATVQALTRTKLQIAFEENPNESYFYVPTLCFKQADLRSNGIDEDSVIGARVKKKRKMKDPETSKDVAIAKKQ